MKSIELEVSAAWRNQIDHILRTWGYDDEAEWGNGERPGTYFCRFTVFDPDIDIRQEIRRACGSHVSFSALKEAMLVTPIQEPIQERAPQSDGVIIAINESQTPMCLAQVSKLAEHYGFDAFIEDGRFESPEAISELVESAREDGYRHVIYLTEESQVTDVQEGLKEDFAGKFNTITVLPENFYRAAIGRLREVDVKTTSEPIMAAPVAQAPIAPKPAVVTKQAPAAKPQAVPTQKFLFIVPTNVPVVGTKAIVEKALAAMPGEARYLAPVPSVGTEINPKTQLTNGTTAKAIWSLASKKINKIDDVNLQAPSWYSCLVPKEKNFNGAFYYKLQVSQQKEQNPCVYTIVSSKEVCAVAASYGFKTISICSQVPNQGANEKVFKASNDLIEKYTKLLKDKNALIEYAKKKNLGQVPKDWKPAQDDLAILTIIQEIYEISHGKKDPTKNNLADDRGLGANYKGFIAALGALIPERDKELAQEWVKDTVVGEYALEAGKAMKKAYDHLKSKDSVAKREPEKKIEKPEINWGDNQVLYVLVNTEDFQGLKNYFDKGFHLVEA